LINVIFSSLDEIQEAFSLVALNNQFYADYQIISKQVIRSIYPKQIDNKLNAHQGTLNLLNRLLFVYFIQKKGWMMNDSAFLYNFWKDYKINKKNGDSFHESWLNKVFFTAFNGKAYSDAAIFKNLPEKYFKKILEFPYLNGGLFTFHNDFDSFVLDDKCFEDIFNFLQNYNFTIDEDSIDEVSLEINPELLGKMYEAMINATDLDDADAENGIVYTERPEINFMTRRSFVEVLNKKFGDKYSREFLYHFCFDPIEEKVNLLKHYKPDSKELIDVVSKITSLDPTCGSGSMLIGVIQLQVELLKSIFEYDKTPLSSNDEFKLKKQIISDCIYGVDIKEWAVRIAELRFWLYMISDAEFTTKELTNAPLLPNLDFKLRQGNSLIQEIGNVEFSIKELFKNRKKNAGATRKLNDYIKKKKDFITNQSESESDYSNLKKEEVSVFKEFIRERIKENNDEIFRLSKGDGQTSMFGFENKGNIFENRITELKDENEKFQRFFNTIKDTGRIPFSYDIDFMEIFITKDNPGFDLIIGNPPYVRQEDILPADDALELERLFKPENKDEKTKVSKDYKEKLSSKVFDTYPFLKTQARTKIDGKTKTIDIYDKKVPGRSDLYVYFQLLAPSLLNSKGTFCFIISNSWLDVEFGGFVQQFLLKHTQLYSIYDCNVRSFSAAVNTVIYLHSSIQNTDLSAEKLKTFIPEGKPVRFIMNKEDYNQISYAPILIEQENCQQNTFRNNYRVIVKPTKELWEEAYDDELLKYESNKWGGKYLKAPEIYFKILEKGGGKIKQLQNYANILPGCYAGISDFFYVNNQIVEKFEIEKEYLIPLLRNSDCVDKLSFDNTGWYVINCQEAKPDIKSGLLNYILWGEKQVTRQRQKTAAGIPYHKTESVKNRKPGWWSIPVNNLETTALFMQYVGSARFYCPISKSNCASDRSFHRIFTEDQNLKYILNSSLTWFFVMLRGRSNLGQGALKFEKSDAIKMEVFMTDTNLFCDDLFNRKPLDIFKELGFNSTIPIRTQQPQPLPDRKELDNIIFDELGLTIEERKEVYWAIAELVKQRLDKAGSR